MTVGDDLASSERDRGDRHGVSVSTGNTDRDAHLASTDFFSAEKNPKMTFVSKQISGSGEEYKLVGDLTLNGITKPVELDVEFFGTSVFPVDQSTHAGFSATGSLSRKDFGIEFNMALGGDKVMISDKVALELDVQLVARHRLTPQPPNPRQSEQCRARAPTSASIDRSTLARSDARSCRTSRRADRRSARAVRRRGRRSRSTCRRRRTCRRRPLRACPSAAPSCRAPPRSPGGGARRAPPGTGRARGRGSRRTPSALPLPMSKKKCVEPDVVAVLEQFGQRELEQPLVELDRRRHVGRQQRLVMDAASRRRRPLGFVDADTVSRSWAHSAARSGWSPSGRIRSVRRAVGMIAVVVGSEVRFAHGSSLPVSPRARHRARVALGRFSIGAASRLPVAASQTGAHAPTGLSYRSSSTQGPAAHTAGSIGVKPSYRWSSASRNQARTVRPRRGRRASGRACAPEFRRRPGRARPASPTRHERRSPEGCRRDRRAPPVSDFEQAVELCGKSASPVGGDDNTSSRVPTSARRADRSPSVAAYSLRSHVDVPVGDLQDRQFRARTAAPVRRCARRDRISRHTS